MIQLKLVNQNMIPAGFSLLRENLPFAGDFFYSIVYRTEEKNDLVEGVEFELDDVLRIAASLGEDFDQDNLEMYNFIVVDHDEWGLMLELEC